jgi:hypothetical protein
MKTCGAKTRSGTPCKRAPMPNGRCKLHGGMATGRPLTTGRYSLKHRASLAEKMQAFRADPQPGDLADELALMRALLADYLERFPTGQPLVYEDIERVVGLLSEISKLVERINRIMTTTALTAAEVQYLQARLADLVTTYVEPQKQEAFLLELSQSLEDRGTWAA